MNVIDELTNEIISTKTQKFKLKKYDGMIYIEYPTTSNFSKTVSFGGWEMSELSDSYIVAYIDGVKQNTAVNRIKRDDVISAIKDYGDANTNPTPGFDLSLDLSNLKDGIHTVTLKLFSKYDEEIDTYSKNIYIYSKVSFGIDVSYYQNNINWTSVKNDGISFAMIRMGYRGYGSGTLVVDSKAYNNIINAYNNGIKVGLYFFSQAVNYVEGAEEARYVLNFINDNGLNGKITLPIAIDTETSGGNGSGRADGISVEARTQAMLGFINTINASGYKGMIYASRNWFYEKLDMSQLSNARIWLAHYTGSVDKTSNYTGTYQIWQYTSSGSIYGITVPVDLNVSFENY